MATTDTQKQLESISKKLAAIKPKVSSRLMDEAKMKLDISIPTQYAYMEGKIPRYSIHRAKKLHSYFNRMINPKQYA